MSDLLQTYLDFARATAREAGELTLRYYQTDAATAEFKSDDTPVTIADREAEQLIRARIGSQFPDHAILGEEFGEADSDATHRWIIDPIDGTKSFVHGVPLYGVLLALEISGTVEVGVAYFPALDEMISAATGLGCDWNGRAARVSSETQLDRAICCHIDTAYFAKNGKGDAWQRLQQSVYYNAGWCDAYGYLLVATGRAEVMLDPVMAVWDCGPFPPIFREAGGYFGDWQGNDGRIDGGEAMATTPALLPEVLRVLKGES
ncbi:MAG: inositol monophosphatase family protein [Verrucomicrobiae bacterium]|nr:inositol monophosphatase family protein [Verrucomicrobiae bacterium]